MSYAPMIRQAVEMIEMVADESRRGGARGDARKGAGRPPLDVTRARHVRVPVTPDEGAALDAWSAREGRPLAVLVRETTLRAAKRSR